MNKLSATSCLMTQNIQLLRSLKSNFGETWDKFGLKLNELREVAIKKINCCDKNVKKVKNIDNIAII